MGTGVLCLGGLQRPRLVLHRPSPAMTPPVAPPSPPSSTSAPWACSMQSPTSS